MWTCIECHKQSYVAFLTDYGYQCMVCRDRLMANKGSIEIMTDVEPVEAPLGYQQVFMRFFSKEDELRAKEYLDIVWESMGLSGQL